MSTRQLAAIMFTDMVGYTALMQESEHSALDRRRKNKIIFEDCLSRHNGKLLQQYGDGTLSINSSAVNAIQSAIEMQKQSRAENIDLRIGLHIGDILTDENGIYGDGVNIASRIEALAVPGSIFISEKMYDDIKNHDDIKARSLGFFELKNVKNAIQVYSIVNDGIISPAREDVKGNPKQIINSIAVLPFISMSSDPENEFFCDGITEEVLNVLAKVEGLQVTCRTSAFVFKGKNQDVREIGAKLNVQKILEGSVRKSGNKVRITVNLINAVDGYRIWNETYDRDLQDIFEVQDEISRVIANKLKANLNETDHKKSLVEAPTQNPEAYKKYLLGKQYWNNASPETRKLGVQLFEEAVAEDPGMIDALAYLAYTYAFMGGSGQIEAHKAIELTKSYSQRAMDINPDHPMALAALAFLKIEEFEWAEGYDIILRALEINPNDVFVRIVAVEYCFLFLEREKGLEHARKMIELDPLAPITLAEAARTFLFFREYHEAIKYSEKALAIDPHNLMARNAKAFATGLTGNWEEALQLMIRT
ncbi:MAG: adenylate/guanylate cyclase domain-containing protein, partial [Saprospiraceae bacterium]